jgi:heme/copper-type cytochrome/quinol oxidase subunit 3
MTAVAAAPAAASGSASGATGMPRAKWGMWMLIVTELMIFLALISSYFYVRAGAHPWPPTGIEKPDLSRISWFTVVLLGSSLPMWWAEAGIRRGRVGRLRLGLAVAWLMGLAFFVNQVFEYRALHFGVRSTVYGSLFYGITGLHGAHLIVGLLMNGIVQVKARMGKFSKEHHLTVEVVSLYWHFVDAVWVLVFSSLYLSPHLIKS